MVNLQIIASLQCHLRENGKPEIAKMKALSKILPAL